MGKGGANMGKLLKGKSREVKGDKKSKAAKPLTEGEFDTIKAVWDRQSRHLKAKIAEEQKNFRVNSRLVTTQMREQMRREKRAELGDEVAILAQEHQREMDRKDAVVQTLQGRLDEVEEQFLVVQRGHASKLDTLSKIHQAKVRQLESEFERDLKSVKTEFNAEREKVLRNHERMKRELGAIIKAVQAGKHTAQESAKTTHETTREEIKNKNLEVINELRINLETKIDELEKEFDTAHIAYIEKTKDKNREFKRLQASDRQMTQENRRRKRKIVKLESQLKHVKSEIEMNRKACTSRNQSLKAQRDEVSQYCRDLKGRMMKRRSDEEKILTQLAVKAREATKATKANVATAERILKLMEAARKLETEREKVLPFYDSTSIDVKSKEAARKEGEDFAAGLKKAGMDAKVGDEEVQWDSLENFNKKFNKVMLDKLAIEQEKKRLDAENRDLRTILQQYLDGIAISEDVVDKDNSLLIINGRTNAKPARVRQMGRPVALEAAQVASGYAKQARARQRT